MKIFFIGLSLISSLTCFGAEVNMMSIMNDVEKAAVFKLLKSASQNSPSLVKVKPQHYTGPNYDIPSIEEEYSFSPSKFLTINCFTDKTGTDTPRLCSIKIRSED